MLNVLASFLLSELLYILAAIVVGFSDVIKTSHAPSDATPKMENDGVGIGGQR